MMSSGADAIELNMQPWARRMHGLRKYWTDDQEMFRYLLWLEANDARSGETDSNPLVLALSAHRREMKERRKNEQN